MDESAEEKRRKWWSSDAIAGFMAGFMTTISTHPIDLIRTRLQVDLHNPSRIGSSFQIVGDISRAARQDGVHPMRAFYRGISPNLVGNTTSWALYFYWYGHLKDFVRQSRGSENTHDLSSIDYLLTSGIAGIAASAITNPIWVVKTRMMSSEGSAKGAYRSMWDGFVRIARYEGLRGFYRGFLTSMFGVTQTAFQFMAYEKLKILRRKQKEVSVIGKEALVLGNRINLTNIDFIAISIISKLFSGAITYPYQVVRTRLQLYNASEMYDSARDVVRRTWKSQGIAGFYKGLIPNMIRVLPSTCVTFIAYENTRRLFSSP